MNVLRILVRALKIIVGVFSIIMCITSIALAFENNQPLFLLETLLFAIIALLLFRRTKKHQLPGATKSRTADGPITIETEYVPDIVPEDTAKDMRKYYTFIQAQRDAEIMVESFSIASTTVAMDVFCSRYVLAMRKAHILLQAEQAGVKGLKKLNCHNTCIAIIDAAHALRIRMLEDYEQSAFSQAEVLKTDRGRLNRYIKIKRSLSNAEPIFTFMEEYETLVSKVDDRILSLGGVIL